MKRMARVPLEGYPNTSILGYASLRILYLLIPGYASFENLSWHIQGYASLDIAVKLILSYPGISHFRKLVLGYPDFLRMSFFQMISRVQQYFNPL